MSENPKDSIGITKPNLNLVPPVANIIESVVMGLGAKKYGPYNWRESGVKASIYVAAAQRHLAQWLDGETTDPESGVSHLAHVRACMGIMLDADSIGKLIDDRPPKGASASVILENTEQSKPIGFITPGPRN
jgi:hypothetical protein